MRTLILAAILFATTPALALTDQYGRTITCTGTAPVECSSGDGTTVQAATPAQALGTFNGMAPSSYTPLVPPPVVPQSVAMWQLQVVLASMPSKTNAGKTMLDDANALAAAAGGATLIAWTHAATVDRTSPTIAAMAPQLGLASADIDAAFVAAAAVTL